MASTPRPEAIADEFLVIECPICQARGEMIHHDIRSSLAYSCQNCLHEWLADALDEPSTPAVGEARRSPNATKCKSARHA